MWRMTSSYTVMVAIATISMCSLSVHSQVVTDGGICDVTKGCFAPDGCNTSDPTNGCTAFASWSLGSDGKLFFNLITTSSYQYIAVGFSNSGGMDNSEVYACTSNFKVIRSRNDLRTNIPLDLVGVSEMRVSDDDGLLTCSFKRELSIDTDSNFLDLSSGNTYTPLLAWGSSLKDSGDLERHVDRIAGGSKIDFSESKAVGVGSSGNPLQKVHGAFMVLAWMGFASIGITTARFFKKSLPGEICGKPSWFTVHRACMVSVVTLGLIAYVVIIIHVRGYLTPEEGNIRFTHAILGTIVSVLGPINVIMALFRPHPGEPRRNLFNWAHWGVGTSAHLLGGVTILLGTSNRENQGNDVLLQSVPPFVFALAAGLVFFHLAIWILLSIIDILKKKVVNTDIPMNAKTEGNATASSTTGLADPPPREEPVIKLVLYAVYVIVVSVGVTVIVLAVAIN